MITNADDEKVGNNHRPGAHGRSVAENRWPGIRHRAREGAVANGRTSTDDGSATWNDVAGDAQDAVAFHESLDERQLAAQAVVGAVESADVRRREADGAGRIEQTVEPAEKGAEHVSSYATSH